MTMVAGQGDVTGKVISLFSNSKHNVDAKIDSFDKLVT